MTRFTFTALATAFFFQAGWGPMFIAGCVLLLMEVVAGIFNAATAGRD